MYYFLNQCADCHGFIRKYRNENSYCQHVPGLHSCTTCKQKIYVQCQYCVNFLTKSEFFHNICKIESRESLKVNDENNEIQTGVEENNQRYNAKVISNIQIKEAENDVLNNGNISTKINKSFDKTEEKTFTDELQKNIEIEEDEPKKNKIVVELTVKDLIECEMKKCLKNESGSNFYQCNYCNFKHLDEYNLLKHQLQNHLVYHNCKQCNRKFVSEKEFIRHQSFSSNPKLITTHIINFHCRYENCSFYSQKPRSLKLHIQNVHIGKKRNKKPSELLRLCKVCGQFFSIKNFLFHSHQMVHHANVCDTEYFICPICSNIRFIKSIKKHMLVHAETILTFGQS